MAYQYFLGRDFRYGLARKSVLLIFDQPGEAFSYVTVPSAFVIFNGPAIEIAVVLGSSGFFLFRTFLFFDFFACFFLLLFFAGKFPT